MLFLDVETTGLSPAKGDRIVEIALVEMIGRELTGKIFHQYINPQREIPEHVIKIHGITNDKVKDSPTFEDISHDLTEFLYPSIISTQDSCRIIPSTIVAHNAEFDMGFLKNEHQMGDWLKLQVLCTKKMARKMDNAPHNAKGYRLDDLKAKYNIDIDRELHGALIDATILAHVYLAMTKDFYL